MYIGQAGTQQNPATPLVFYISIGIISIDPVENTYWFVFGDNIGGYD